MLRRIASSTYIGAVAIAAAAAPTIVHPTTLACSSSPFSSCPHLEIYDDGGCFDDNRNKFTIPPPSWSSKSSLLLSALRRPSVLLCDAKSAFGIKNDENEDHNKNSNNNDKTQNKKIGSAAVAQGSSTLNLIYAFVSIIAGIYFVESYFSGRIDGQRKELSEKIERQGKDLSEKIEKVSEKTDCQFKDLTNTIHESERRSAEKSDRQGKELSEKIDHQGKELSEKIERQGKELSEKIDHQGKELSEKIERQGKDLCNMIHESERRSAEKTDAHFKELVRLIKGAA